jgi:hypothetical protein
MSDDPLQDPPETLSLFVWATKIVRRGDGRAELVAVKPKKEITVAEASEILGVSPRVVRRIWKAGLIEGWKPGAIAERSDGRGSNAELKLDAESVLRYKQKACRAGALH